MNKENKKQIEDVFNLKDKVNVTIRDKEGNIKERTIIRNNIMRPAKDCEEYKKRFNKIHILVKQKIVHRALKILKWLIGKYLIKSIEDIPKEPVNNLMRIFYHSYMTGLEQTYKQIIFDNNIKKGIKYDMTRDENWQQWLETSQHCHARILLLNLWMTEVLEDSFDRSITELAMIETYHQMNKLYKNKVPTLEEFKVYNKQTPRDIEYFVNKQEEGIWNR